MRLSFRLRNSPSMKSLFWSSKPVRLACNAPRFSDVSELKKMRATLIVDRAPGTLAFANVTELSSADWTLRAKIEPSTSITPGGTRKYASALAGSGGTPGVKHGFGMIVRGVEGLLQYSFATARAVLSKTSIRKS